MYTPKAKVNVYTSLITQLHLFHKGDKFSEKGTVHIRLTGRQVDIYVLSLTIRSLLQIEGFLQDELRPLSWATISPLNKRGLLRYFGRDLVLV